MEVPISYCLERVAPLYNLVLVAILVGLFIMFFAYAKKSYYLVPWKYMFIAVFIYIVEEVLTVMQKFGLIEYPRILHAVLEMCMISLFIYMILLQKEYIEKQLKAGKSFSTCKTKLKPIKKKK